MTKRDLFGVAGVLSLTMAGAFVYSPVFAEGPVDIDIIEMVDDGMGNYKDWEDITGAMPGDVYSTIPRVQNNGSVAALVRMCLSESGMDATGNVIELDNGTFTIDINDAYWTRDTGSDNGGSVSSPIDVCYKYNTELAVGGVTEPLFYQVSLSSELGNEHSNATFRLHLYAEGTNGLPDDSDESDGSVSPINPDTGVVTNSEPLTTAGYISLSVGLVVLLGMIALLLRRSVKKK
ncbi:hypothetical protein IKG05_00215 [Candidatus Saccharibacteria bacterium]|nr:hypothetical protein [Candidatus Saccharibacteria bacterium]